MRASIGPVSTGSPAQPPRNRAASSVSRLAKRMTFPSDHRTAGFVGRAPRPTRAIASGERAHDRGRRQHTRETLRARLRRPVAGKIPGRNRLAAHSEGAPIAIDHRAVGKGFEWRLPYPLQPPIEALAMEDEVHLRRAWPRASAERGAKRLGVGAPAFEAGPMSSREGRHLVEEKEFRVALAPDFAMAPLERAEAGDPLPRGPATLAQRPVGAVEPTAAIAHQRPARRSRDKSAVRIDTILQRARGVHCG